MKRCSILLFSLVLASCGDLPNPMQPSVTGKIEKTKHEGKIMINTSGIELGGGILINGKKPQVVLPKLIGDGYVYTVNLPEVNHLSGIGIFAFVDKNGNEKYDLSEPKSKEAYNFVYVDKDYDILGFSLKQGWNSLFGNKFIEKGYYFTGKDFTFN